MLVREIGCFAGLVVRVVKIARPLNKSNCVPQENPRQAEQFSRLWRVRPAWSLEVDHADHLSKSLFDHLNIPIFGEEGDIDTFIYIVEGQRWIQECAQYSTLKKDCVRRV